MHKILICEDEENIVSFIKTELQFEGFTVDVAYDGGEALNLFAANQYDLVLLDIMIPVKNGLECLREIRKTSNIPVIMLTARKEVYDKVAFLNAGADDYITKPFDTLELLARIKRNIDRNILLSIKPSANSDAGLIINKDAYRTFLDGNEIQLSKTEFEILSFLHENSDKVKSRSEIIQAVFGDYYGESNIVDSNIKNIRAKLNRHTKQEIIATVRGKGYVIRKDV